MKQRKFPFLKCCEWLYQSALAAGILFILYGFLQNELAKISAFPQEGALLGLVLGGILGIQLLLNWSGEKGYLTYAGIALLVLNLAAGVFLTRQLERSTDFWCYLGLEAACILGASLIYAIRDSAFLKGILVLAEAVSLVVLAILKKPLPGMCVAVMLVAFLFFLVELNAPKQKELLEVLPFFVAAMLVLGFLPKNEKPLDWSWVKDACIAVQERFKMQAVDAAYLFSGEDQFSYSFSGYGNSGKTGGMVLDDPLEQLRISGRTKNPLYLTGKTYDVYTDSGWEDSRWETGAFTGKTDPLPNAFQNSIYADEEKSLAVSRLISVEYRFIKTKDFFHELHTTNLYGAVPEFQKNTPWTMKRAKGKDFSYQFRFLEIDENSDAVQALLRQEAWKANAVWDEDLSRYEKELYEIYTKLPEGIPSRVYELAQDITAGCGNDYDRMKAFVAYFKDYTYTKTPPACPENREFVDYFLFESKSGYCTYFATAMAVLGRCAGIPTRYVTGFMTADSCKNSPVELTVTGEQAHAWTEAYIEHIGWVRFDATPGYGVATGSFPTNPDFSPGMEELGKPVTPATPPKEQPPEELEPQPKPFSWYALVVLRILLVLLAGCGLGVAAIWIRNLVRRMTYRSADSGEKVRLQIKRLMYLGKLQGVSLSEGETLQAYRKKAQEILDTKEYSFETACDLYEGIRFGGRTVSPLELQRLEAYAKMAEKAYLASCGFFKRLAYHIA